MNPFPPERITPLNREQLHPDADFVLYWMIAFRRAHWNFSLQRAADWAFELKKPLVILEPLRCDYPWASDRFHSFLLEGMKDNRSDFQNTPALYFPYVEMAPGQGKGLLRHLAAKACVLVTDDFPAFFLPRMLRAAAKNLPVKMEAVDSNGLLPMARADRVFSTAHAFRRFLQQQMPALLDAFPKQNPLEGLPVPVLQEISAETAAKWPMATHFLDEPETSLSRLPLNHAVAPVETHGGATAAREQLAQFLHTALHRYHTDRNHPDEDAGSRLSAYLHFGHLSVHEIFSRLCEREQWSPEDLCARSSGQREGWWNMSPGAEGFLDQLLTWRELGLNRCSRTEDYGRYESLPAWALQTLAAHAQDPRPHLYSPRELETASTHDPLWNAAQRQLTTHGEIHNYLRMLWGKKILEWTASPRQALEIMIELNNKYALDGRDPNSYTGIFWVLGRYDRAFGPRRPVFGTVRYMSSGNTLKKLRLADYLHRFA